MTFGQSYLPSNVVGAMFSLIPLTTIGLSAVFLGVYITRRKLSGLFIGFLGLIVITEPAKWVGSTGLEHALPMMASLGAIFCFASAAILMRIMPKRTSAVVNGRQCPSCVDLRDCALYDHFRWRPSTVASVDRHVGGFDLIYHNCLFHPVLLDPPEGSRFLAPNAYVGVILVNVFGVTVMGNSITLAMLIAFPLIFLGLFIAQDGSGNMKQV